MTNTQEEVVRAAATARRLADGNPEALLPCPACAAEVKGKNLDEHLRKVHELVPSGAGVGDATWSGADGKMRILTLGPVAVVLILFVPLTMVIEDAQLAAGVFSAAFVAAVVPVVLAYLNKFRARLSVENDGLRLSYGLGLLSKEIASPFLLESGALVRRKDSNLAKAGHGYYGRLGTPTGPVEDVRVGAFMCIVGERGSIVIGTSRGPGLAKYWDAEQLRTSSRRRLWHINLDAVQLVQLQYAFAERGWLRPRE